MGYFQISFLSYKEETYELRMSFLQFNNDQEKWTHSQRKTKLSMPFMWQTICSQS